MTILPIVERELRLAARRRLTFWLRVVAALAAVVVASGLFALMSQVGGGLGVQPGGPLFAVLTWMTLIVTLCAGLFFTSDSLSEEKREGTLGFLFLTDLRGYDVVFGKLLATSCRCVFALLAIFPVLACTQLFCGVELVEFWQTVLALLHALFFSLVVGLFISAVSQHPQKALVGTLLLLFLLLAGGPALDGFYAFTEDRSFRPILSLASPINVFLSASGPTGNFRSTLLVSEAVVWGLLAAACLVIPRNWQVKAGRGNTQTSAWRQWWRYGSTHHRTELRRQLLARHPFTWLACRERWQSLIAWAFALMLVCWFVAVSCFDNSFFSWVSWRIVGALTMLFLYLWSASQACQVLADIRRSGLIELLLATPMSFREVATGVWRGMLRSFGVPIGVVIAVFALAMVIGDAQDNLLTSMGDKVLPMWVLRWGGAFTNLVVTIANFGATIWFGLWMGLISRNGLIATLKTVAFVQIIPMMVIGFASWMVIPLLAFSSGGWTGSPILSPEWYPVIVSLLMTILTLLKDFLFWMISYRKLTGQFRETAVRAVLPATRYRLVSRPVPIPAGVPPVIPPRRPA